MVITNNRRRGRRELYPAAPIDAGVIFAISIIIYVGYLASEVGSAENIACLLIFYLFSICYVLLFFLYLLGRLLFQFSIRGPDTIDGIKVVNLAFRVLFAKKIKGLATLVLERRSSFSTDLDQITSSFTVERSVVSIGDKTMCDDTIYGFGEIYFPLNCNLVNGGYVLMARIAGVTLSKYYL